METTPMLSMTPPLIDHEDERYAVTLSLSTVYGVTIVLAAHVGTRRQWITATLVTSATGNVLPTGPAVTGVEIHTYDWRAHKRFAELVTAFVT